MNKLRKNTVDVESDFHVPTNISKELAWGIIESRIKSKDHVVTSFVLNQRILTQIIATAASIALIITIYLIKLPTDNVFITDGVTKRSIFLPDGSEVILNSETVFHYNPKKWNKKRIVELDGEAFFRVKKGSSFIVKTKLGNVTVIGTSFNVLSRNNDFQVSCLTGKVKVESPDKKASAFITKGLFVKYLDIKEFSLPEEIDSERIAYWQSSDFVFSNTPLQKVISELEKHYNVNIYTQNIEGRYYTGFFPKNNLEKALILICTPMNMSFNIVNNLEIEITTLR